MLWHLIHKSNDIILQVSGRSGPQESNEDRYVCTGAMALDQTTGKLVATSEDDASRAERVDDRICSMF